VIDISTTEKIIIAKKTLKTVKAIHATEI